MSYDTVVVGSGAGGTTLAVRLAERGQRVLVIERGEHAAGQLPRQTEQSLWAGLAGYDFPIWVGQKREQPLLGSMVGGSTGLYGAVLLRPAPSDWTPGRWYGAYLERSLWDYPFPYEELEPYLEESEDLCAVAGDAYQGIPHLGRRQRPYLQTAMPLTPFNETLRSSLHAGGVSAFRLPLAIDLKSCQRCAQCPGFLCPTAARGKTWTERWQGLVASGRLSLATRHEVTRILWQNRKVSGLRVRGPEGQEQIVQGDHYVLAGGALGTARLGLFSELRDESGLLGRNFMFHLGVACLSLGRKRALERGTFQKQLGFADLYHGTPEFSHKLGVAQSIPIPGAFAMQQKLPLSVPSAFLKALHRRLHLFVLMLEDLPQRSNRVRLKGAGLQLEHSFHPYDHFRAQGARSLLTRIFRESGFPFSWSAVAAFEKKHLGHQVGTCRMGLDPRSSVVDSTGRFHAYDNLFVADGSWLPTSLGVGPALTIMAQALRLADTLRPVSDVREEKVCSTQVKNHAL